MNSSERLEYIDRSAPLDFIRKFRERLRLPILQSGKRLDDSASQSRKEIWPVRAREFKHVARKLAMVRALFDQDEVVDLTKSFPDFRRLRGQHLPNKLPPD